MTYFIERVDTSDWYKFQLIQNLSDSLGQEGIPLPVPGNQPESSLVFTLQAQTREITLRWRLFDNGKDKSKNDSDTSTAPNNADFDNGTVVTLQEQKTWLQDYIFDGTLGVQYKIHGDSFQSSGVKCSIRDLSIDQESGKPTQWDGQLRLTVGTV